MLIPMIVGFLIDRCSIMDFAIFLVAVAFEPVSLLLILGVYYVTFLFQQKLDEKHLPYHAVW